MTMDTHTYSRNVSLGIDELNQLTFMNRIKPQLALAARGRCDLTQAGLRTIAQRVKDDGTWDTESMVENGFGLAFELGRQLPPHTVSQQLDGIRTEASAVRDAIAGWASHQGKAAAFATRLRMFAKTYDLPETSTITAPLQPDDQEALRRRLAASGLVMPGLGTNTRH